MIIPGFFLDSVMSIGVRTGVHSIAWIGTGFFVGKSDNDNPNEVYPILVTNKHVFLDKKKVVIRMKKKDSDALQEVDLDLIDKNGNKLYLIHDTKDIDIAVMPIKADYLIENNLDFNCFNIDTHAMTSAELRSSGVDEGSIIYMLGFPMSLVNISSNLPICRMGCISRMSETQIAEQHNLLVDIQNFPGNSGSPVITRPENMAITGTASLSKSVLVGIIHSYLPYKEKLISSQTNEVVEIRSENSGLAYVHPVEYIREIIDKIYPKTK